jgi:hypothetical protein
MTKRTAVLIGFLTLAVASRLLILGGTAWVNFSPIASMALFAGIYFKEKVQAISWTILAVWFSNVLLNNLIYTSYYPSFSLGFDGVHMGIFALITLLGSRLNQQKITALNFISTNLVSGIGFFLLSNFAVWLSSEITYAKSIQGLLACYTAGLPFLKNTMASQFIFSAIFFGTFEYLKKRIPVLN